MAATAAVPAHAQAIRVAPLTQVHSTQGVLENVCHLRTARTRMLLFSSPFNSSGVLYRGRYVITAAHNVHSTLLSRLRRLSVACGVPKPADADHQQISLRDVRVASSYGWFPKRWDRDFAVIRLPQAKVSSVQMELNPLSLNQQPLRLHLAGFPGAPGGGAMNGERMFYGNGQGMVDAEEEFLHYSIETFVGNSGGPVWLVEAGRPVLAGIHISGGDIGGRARLANAEFVQHVERMIVELEVSE